MQPSANPRELKLHVNGMRFAAQEWGDVGGLPVLALHGWLDNSASFSFLAPRLKDLHLVAIDFAGHGRSDHRPGQMSYTLWDDINDVLAIADHLGWKRFALLGHSRGAIVSTITAGAFPDRILYLGLVEGFLPEAVPAEEAPRQLARAIESLRSQQKRSPTVYPSLVDAIKARERGMFPLGYEAAKVLTERGVIANGEGFSWGTDRRLLAPSVIRLSREQLDAFAFAIKAPAKLILATRGLPELYKNCIEEISRFPHIEFELLEGGHHLHMEQQVDLVAEKLNDFYSGFIKKNLNSDLG